MAGGHVLAPVEIEELDALDERAARAPDRACDLRGGDAAHNADVVRRLLAGEHGPVRDAVLLNAGAALAVYDSPDEDVEPALAAGVAKATQAIDSGAAHATLERWVAEHEAFKVASLRWKRVIEEVEEQLYRAERERLHPQAEARPEPAQARKSTALAAQLATVSAAPRRRPRR